MSYLTAITIGCFTSSGKDLFLGLIPSVLGVAVALKSLSNGLTDVWDEVRREMRFWNEGGSRRTLMMSARERSVKPKALCKDLNWQWSQKD